MFSLLKTTVIATLLAMGDGEELNHSSCDITSTLAKSMTIQKAHEIKKSCVSNINHNIKIIKDATITYDTLHATTPEPKRDYCKELARLYQNGSTDTFMHEFIPLSTACKQQINSDKQKYNNAVRTYQNKTHAQSKKMQVNTTKK